MSIMLHKIFSSIISYSFKLGYVYQTLHMCATFLKRTAGINDMYSA